MEAFGVNRQAFWYFQDDQESYFVWGDGFIDQRCPKWLRQISRLINGSVLARNSILIYGVWRLT
jgi:hypothetical protein